MSGVFFEFGAGNETRTRDPDLGKVVLYQLSYSRLTSLWQAKPALALVFPAFAKRECKFNAPTLISKLQPVCKVSYSLFFRKLLLIEVGGGAFGYRQRLKFIALQGLGLEKNLAHVMWIVCKLSLNCLQH